MATASGLFLEHNLRIKSLPHLLRLTSKRNPSLLACYLNTVCWTGVSEQVRRAFNTTGVATTLKPYRTLRQTLVSLKDKTEIEDQSGVVYQLSCKDCNASYIGESGTKLGKRLSEHKSSAASSKPAVRDHVVRSGGHDIDWTGVKSARKGIERIFSSGIGSHPN